MIIKKKIGMCIQFEGINNYGTLLQAMENKYIVEQLGYEPRLIRYKKKYDYKFISQVPRYWLLCYLSIL